MTSSRIQNHDPPKSLGTQGSAVNVVPAQGCSSKRDSRPRTRGVAFPQVTHRTAEHRFQPGQGRKRYSDRGVAGSKPSAGAWPVTKLLRGRDPGAPLETDQGALTVERKPKELPPTTSYSGITGPHSNVQ